MRKSLLALLVVSSFGVFTAMAQDSSSGASQTTTTTSTQSTSGAMGGSSGQSGSNSTVPPQKDSAMSNGAMQTGNDTDQMLEGCLVKEQSAYYLQPETGGARTQLSPSRSLDAYVGQHIQVKGRNDGGDSAAAASSGSTSAMSSQGELTVTGIKVVSASCSPTSGTMRQR